MFSTVAAGRRAPVARRVRARSATGGSSSGDSASGAQATEGSTSASADARVAEPPAAASAPAAPSSAITGAASLQEWFGPNRRVYIPETTPPAHLDGTLPGDHGLDPLGLGADPKALEHFRCAEIMHGRFAMLAIIGIFVPEILVVGGSDIKGAVWWQTGSEMLGGQTLNYAGTPVPLPLQGVIFVNAALVFLVEWYRFRGEAEGWKPESTDPVYPGGPFDPLGLSKNPERFAVYQLNEIRNGRLAQMAFLGCVFQAYVTRKGPWQNLLDFLEDPTHNNIMTEWPTDASKMSL